jgi:2-hydroxymuconate-semialdehyde hydrolase
MTASSPAPLQAKYFDFEGTRACYFEGGRTDKLPLLMMHGVGPGASVSGAFAPIFEFVLEHFHVFALDFIGFGGSGKKTAPPYFDFALWVRQATELVSRMPPGEFGIFGHSMSGAIALRLAARLPRVISVICTGTAGTEFRLTPDLERLWTFPRSRDEVRLAIESLVYDADLTPDAEVDRRWSILGVPGYGDYFTAMFEGDRAARQALINEAVLYDAELAAIRVPVTLIHGREDRACPWDTTSLPLAGKIANCDLVLLAKCGHAPSMERPRQIIACLKSAFEIDGSNG